MLKCFVIYLVILIFIFKSTSVSTSKLAWQSCFVSLLVLVEFSEDDDLVDGLGELPAAEDEEVRSDGRRGVAVPLRRWIADVLAVFPLHFFGTPYLKVFALLLFQDVLVAVA